MGRSSTSLNAVLQYALPSKASMRPLVHQFERGVAVRADRDVLFQIDQQLPAATLTIQPQ
jgi:hypothetical protein